MLRLDARGNKKNVQAEFSLDGDKLAFYPNDIGEIDYHDNHSQPDRGLMAVLEKVLMPLTCIYIIYQTN